MEDLRERLMMDAPIPGQSLTNSPDNPRPFETPPEMSDAGEATEALFQMFTSIDLMPKITEYMRQQVPVEDIAFMFLFDMFRTGKISPDMMLVLIEPTIYLLVAIADMTGIKVNIYPEEDTSFTVGEEAEMLKSLKAAKGDVDKVEAPEEVTTSLLDAIKSQVSKEK